MSAFNAQGWRGIIVAGQAGAVRIYVGAVRIYVAAVEPLRKRERQGETREPSKLIFAGFFNNLTLCMTKLRVLVLSFPCLYRYLYYLSEMMKFLKIFLLFSKNKTIVKKKIVHLL